MARGPLLTFTILFASVTLVSAVNAQVSFFQPPTYAGNCTAIFAADFNGDGKPDILCSDGTLNLGNGDGTFTLGTQVSGTPLAVADFNGDGKPDIFEQGTGTLLVLLGNGDGTFQFPISTPSGASLPHVAVGDVNGDGKPDIVGLFNGALYVYLGRGDGTFFPGTSFNVGTSTAVSLALGDFNGDGKVDVVVGAQNEQIVLLGNGDGTFQPPLVSSGPQFPGFTVVGDFNGDGKLDLAVAILGPAPGPTYVMLGNGDGTFQTPILAFAGGLLAVVDLNNDGKLDLVQAAPGETEIFLGNGDGTFSNANDYLSNLGTNFELLGLAVADFNLDGRLDIATGNVVLLGKGNDAFAGNPFGVVPGNISAVVTGDFEKSGHPDVAVVGSSPNGDTVYVLHNDGTGALFLIHSYVLPSGQYNNGIATADLNRDGKLDLVAVGTDPTQNWSYAVLVGNGDGSFQPPALYEQTAAFVSNPVLADFNGDGAPDLAVLTNNQVLGVLLGNGDGTFAAPVYYFNANANSLFTADFNGDGKLDLAAGQAILFGNGDGTFQPAILPPSLNGIFLAFAADLNDDGKVDLIGQSGNIALGKGDGTFTELSAQLSGNPMAVADFNGDGRLDVFVSTPGPLSTQTGVQLGNGDGTFGTLINVPPSGRILPSAAIDMNGDGRPDIVFPTGALGWVGIGVLINTTPADFALSGTSTSQTISAGQTATFSLSIATAGTFTGTVNLSCAITPVVNTAPPTCGVSPTSLQITGPGSQTVTVTVSTIAPVNTGTLSPVRPPNAPTIWASILLASGLLLAQNRKRRVRRLTFIAVFGALSCVGCGGGSSSQTPHTIPGTPAGTYTATVTATSGALSHNIPLQVVVQ